MTLAGRRPLSPSRETTPALTAWADVTVALAAVACLPGACRLLPWTVPLVLWPWWADRLRLAAWRGNTVAFVPDPLRPDWAGLAVCLREAAQLAAGGRRSVGVLLCPLRGERGERRAYTLDYCPARSGLVLRHGASRHETRLRVALRPALPLPLAIADEPVALRLTPAAGGAARLSLRDSRAVSRSLPAALLGSAAAAAADPWCGVAAGVAALTRLLAWRAAGGTLGWWPLRAAEERADAPSLARFDVWRLWGGTLWLLRFALRDLPAGAFLQDPVRLLGWGVLAPPALLALARRLRPARRRTLRKAS